MEILFFQHENNLIYILSLHSIRKGIWWAKMAPRLIVMESQINAPWNQMNVIWFRLGILKNVNHDKFEFGSSNEMGSNFKNFQSLSLNSAWRYEFF